MTTAPTLTPAAFAAKWRGSTTGEKAAAEEHFIDLCRMLGEPTPHEADPIGSMYAFEKRVAKAGEGDGFANVWERLLRLGVQGPPQGPQGRSRTRRPRRPATPRRRPRIEPAQITEKAASHFAEIAQSLRARGHEPERVAHFLDRILFCLFAEDGGLLPKGIFQRLSAASKGRSDVFTNALADLFAKMSKAGGLFGTEEIDWFNGGLFDSAEALPLTNNEITALLEVSRLNWALIEPAIFGTLFERGLDRRLTADIRWIYCPSWVRS